MKTVLIYFICGFIGHFTLLFIDSAEMDDFRTYTLKEKIRCLLLNTSLGYFTLGFALFSLGLEIYVIEKEKPKYNQSNLTEENEEITIPDELDAHNHNTKYL